MTGGANQLSARSLTAESFAPFGRVIKTPERSADANGPGWSWWGENELLSSDGRPFGIGHLALSPTDLRFDWAERHLASQEAIVPLQADCLVYVARPTGPGEPVEAPPPESFEVFRVPSGQGVVLGPGVWHGAPFAVDHKLNAVVLLLEGTGANDTTVIRFPESPVSIAAESAKEELDADS
jgi:ureidoglycolate lyase